MNTLWLCIFATHYVATVFAEGSGNFFPLGSPQCTNEAPGICRANLLERNVLDTVTTQAIFHIFAQAGEVILMGSTAQGVTSRANILLFGSGHVSIEQGLADVTLDNATLNCNSQLPSGKISNRQQELAGAQPAPGGYPPCVFSVMKTGIYSVLFFGPTESVATPGHDIGLTNSKNFDSNQGSSVAAWDIGVRSSLDAVADIPGRVFIYHLNLLVHRWNQPISGTCFVATRDGYQYKVEYRHVQAGTLLVRGGQLGCLEPDHLTPLYHDRLPNTRVPHSLPEFPFFFNPPDNATLAALNYSLIPLLPSLNNVRYSGSVSQRSSGSRLEGAFEFTVPTPAVYEIVIYPFAIASPTFTDGLNRVLRGYARAGTTTVLWDGRNNVGDMFPNEWNMAISDTPHFEIRLHYGEFHLALIDWEMIWYGGPILTLLNAPCPAITGGCQGAFYDDRGYYMFSQNSMVGDVNGTVCGMPMPGVPSPLFSDPKYGFDSSTNQRKWGVSGIPSTDSTTPGPCKLNSNFFGDSNEMAYWTFSPGPSQIAAFYPVSGLSGHVWLDSDGDSVQSPQETGISNLTVVASNGLVAYRNNTDEFGNYFLILPVGVWSVVLIVSHGLTCSGPGSIVQNFTLASNHISFAQPIGCFKAHLSPSPGTNTPAPTQTLLPTHTLAPTSVPSDVVPTVSPTITFVPTRSKTTFSPTSIPTSSQSPTGSPTTFGPTPMVRPSQSPTNGPTASPTSNSTVEVPYRGVSLSINAPNGVQVFFPSDPMWGSEGTVKITVKPMLNTTVSLGVSIEFLNEAGIKQNITGLVSPILVHIPMASVTGVAACSRGMLSYVTPECHWLDLASGRWVTDGCTTHLFATALECSCTHLTDFAAVIPDHIPIAPTHFVSLNTKNIFADPAGLLTILILDIIFAVLLVVASRVDTSKRKPAELRHNGRTLLSSESHAAPNILERYWDLLRNRHTLGCICPTKKGLAWRYVDRVLVTALLVFTLLGMATMFHGHHHAYVGRLLVVVYSGLTGALVVLMSTNLLIRTGDQGFKDQLSLRYFRLPSWMRCMRGRFPERSRWLWYGIISLVIAILTVYILAEALMFAQNPAYYCQGSPISAWIYDVVLAYVFVILLVEPLAMLLLLIVADTLRRQRGSLDMALLEDNSVALISHDNSQHSKDLNQEHDKRTLVVSMGDAGPPLEANSASSTHEKSFPDLPCIDFSEIEILSPLGNGVSGMVDKCIWRGADCAIKRLRDPNAVSEFQREVSINRHLSAFKHQCVVSFLGVTQNPPGILLELYPLRSVQDYIITEGHLRDSLCDLLTVMISASAGILQLHANGVIHRDISARNFLIKHDLTTAVCDMGLAVLLQPCEKVGNRSMEERQNDRLPVNTTAPESLLRGEYSPQSDVYMFGIFLWELLARTPPFSDDPDLSPESRDVESFAASIQGGLQLTVPPEWPEALRTLMQSCWAVDPTHRPSMHSVNRALRDFRKSVEEQKDLAVPVAPNATASSMCYQRFSCLDIYAKVMSVESQLAPTPTAFDMYERLPCSENSTSSLDKSQPLRLYTSSGPHKG